MRLLVILGLIGLTWAYSPTNYRYAFVEPSSQDQPWSQFDERSGDQYAWGYEFPGRVHVEAKDDNDVVKGTFGFVDPNGSQNIWRYISDPINGFQVKTAVVDAVPEASEPVVASADAPGVSIFSNKQQIPIPSTYTRAQAVNNVLSPLLKNAAAEGYLVPAGSSLSGSPQYAVDPDVAAEAGSLSALAERFGAIPVAAVHDAQRRFTYSAPDSAFAPVLVHREQPDFTLYTLEVPVQ